MDREIKCQILQALTLRMISPTKIPLRLTDEGCLRLSFD